MCVCVRVCTVNTAGLGWGSRSIEEQEYNGLGRGESSGGEKRE